MLYEGQEYDVDRLDSTYEGLKLEVRPALQPALARLFGQYL